MLHEYDVRTGIHVFFDTLLDQVCEQKTHGLPVQWAQSIGMAMIAQKRMLFK